ncbi:MAG: branched-chain amino acid ABC transporter permease [Armatimonadetes bacterium]|nr:branched-chain amino acid ABC transporter permease [Armatimonadota bacterium]
MHPSYLIVAGLDFTALPQQLVNGLLLGAIYALIALGYTMVYGVLKLINFAHGEVYMLGAYTALFTSWYFGFLPNLNQYPNSSFWILLIMLAGSMIVCAIIGVLIERFAYRPMRNNSRIASLITAIGVSLLFQYGGALFLPNSPPPSVAEKVNPFGGAFSVPIIPADAKLSEVVKATQPDYEQKKKDLEEYLASTGQEEFSSDPQVVAKRDAKQAAEQSYMDAKRKLETSGVKVTIQRGQLTMLLTAIVLMLGLRYLVLKTPAGRAMRAVSLDFDSAALMGINVDRVITWTFVIGSAMAGAGAMMTATFLGTPLTTQYGVQPGVKAFVAAVLGGIGNIPGAALGGILMGVAENLVVWIGFSQYRDAIAFVVLIFILLYRPGGLLGSAKVEKV